VSCDEFTRGFYSEHGLEQPEAEEFPVDAALLRSQTLAKTGPKAEVHGALLFEFLSFFVCSCTAIHSGEITLAGSCCLRSTLVVALVVFAHAVVTAVKILMIPNP
jgi:hypothetical protein